MFDEYNALLTNGMWILVPRPANMNVVRFMCLFRQKFHTDGSLSRYKARLVVNGCSQQQGINGDETFSPVVKPATICTILSLAVDDIILYNVLSDLFYNRSTSGMFMSRSKFAEEILVRAHMQNCNSSDLSDHQTRQLWFCVDRTQLQVSSTAQLTAYTDANWAGVPVTQYRGVVNVVAETAWTRNLLCELHAPLFTTTLVYCDNVSVVYMHVYLIQHQCTKHIEIDIHFVLDFVASGQVCVLHVPSQFQYAYIFTKGLPTALFLDFR
ncbi:ribonuclease H-like domain-containing protein [Tanacetum coccineum]